MKNYSGKLALEAVRIQRNTYFIAHFVPEREYDCYRGSNGGATGEHWGWPGEGFPPDVQSSLQRCLVVHGKAPRWRRADFTRGGNLCQSPFRIAG